MNYIAHTIRGITAAALLLAGGAAVSGQTMTSYFWSNLAGKPGITGNVDGVGTNAMFNYPRGVALDQSANVFVSDDQNSTIRMVTPDGVVTTIAGSPGIPGSADGTGSEARFNEPDGMAFDSTGNLVVADFGNHTIRMITTNGVVTTVAGTPGIPGTTDGPASVAQFYNPSGLVFDKAGNLFIADRSNNTIRKMTRDGEVTTFAGTPGVFGHADGVGTNTLFDLPNGLAVDGADNLFVGDRDNEDIRKITASGVVTTVAGNYLYEGSADGKGSAARFNLPFCVAVDSADNLFVTDRENSTIRKITSSGVVTTIGGTAQQKGTVDGLGTAARFDWPHGIALDSMGNLYVVDRFNHRISKGIPNRTASLKMRIQLAPQKMVDRADLKWLISLPVGLGVSNVTAQLSIGSVSVPFPLNSAGVGQNGLSRIAVRRKGKPVTPDQLWQVSAKLQGDWTATWGGDGLIDATTNLTLAVPVMLLLDTDPAESISIEQVLSYKATLGKGGSAK
jgi:sugar lactone lactonase YvrE